MKQNNESSREDSLKKRYTYSLFNNFIGLVAGGVTSVVVPRALGPVAYGNFSFLTNFLQQVVNFLDVGTSKAFFTKLSQRPDEQKLRSFYLYVSLVITGSLAAFLALVSAFSLREYIWPGQHWIFISAATFWALGTWYSKVLKTVTDAYALTVQAQMARVVQRILAVILILLLFLLGWLNLYTLFLYHYAIILFLCVAWVKIVYGKGHSLWGGNLKWSEIRCYLSEFYQYCSPLFMMGVIGLPLLLFDRWLLQMYAGSVEQGFYGLSYRIGAICFLFTGAMAPLLTREFSVAFGRKDLKQMAFLFRRYIPLLYSIAAFFSCFIALRADEVIYITGGSHYAPAAMAVTIMAFYPIHQTYGQLSASVFYATGQTRLFRNISISIMLIGLPVTYFLIAPPDQMGLNAGATGLAIKMVVMQFIGVNVELFFNSKLLKLNFWKYLSHQIVSVGAFLGLGTTAIVIVEHVLYVPEKGIASFIGSGFVYTLLVGGVLLLCPILFGLHRNDIKELRARFLRPER